VRRRWIGWLIVLGVAAVGALVARVALFPRPLATGVSPPIVELRARIAVAGLVMGAGLGVAAVGAQASAREHRVDATLTGPAWGALPGLLVPVAPIGQAVVCLVGAAFVAYMMRRASGLGDVVTRGLAVAGAVVALAAFGLFVGPGLTPSTATVFLHAALGGTLTQATWDRTAIGAVLVALALAATLVRWRSLSLARAGLDATGEADTVTVLAAAGAVLVAGVVPGLGLLAALLARRLVGEDPRMLGPGAFAAGIAVGLTLDGLGQALAWPGELPVGVLSLGLASLVLGWEVFTA
jgi:iron complex transport system permease protein